MLMYVLSQRSDHGLLLQTLLVWRRRSILTPTEKPNIVSRLRIERSKCTLVTSDHQKVHSIAMSATDPV